MRFPISPDNLELVARVFDKWDRDRGDTSGNEVQRDIRAMASQVTYLGTMPTVVCLIGSTRFMEVFNQKIFEFSVAGKIVLSVGAVTSDIAEEAKVDYDLKHKLDILHLWKILLADEVYCINVGGYIGASTAREIGFATQVCRPITFHEPVQPGMAVRTNLDIPMEVVEYAFEARKALGLDPAIDRVSLLPWAHCFVRGCPERASVSGQEPLHGLHPQWVSDTRGGVTRWFCGTEHLGAYREARKQGMENAHYQEATRA